MIIILFKLKALVLYRLFIIRSPMFEERVDDLNMFTELGIYSKSGEDYIELQYILKDLLQYPSDRLADLHSMSNRLGSLDLMEQRAVLSAALWDNSEGIEICQCCYLLRQKGIGYCRPIHHIVPLGEATKLFFNDLKYCILLLFVTLLTYSIYSLVTNITSSNNNLLSCIENRTCKLALIGLGSKLYTQKSARNNTLYIIQAYLGLVMICFWTVILLLKMCQQQNIRKIQDLISPTASDFTLTFKGLPKVYTQEDLQTKLNHYAYIMKDEILSCHKQTSHPNQYNLGFTIRTFNTVREYYETLKISQRQLPSPSEIELKQKLQQLKNMIISRAAIGDFPLLQPARVALYKSIDCLRVQVTTQRIKKLERIQETYKLIDKTSTKIVFITFDHTYACHNLLRMNQYSILSRITNFGGNPCGLDIPGLKIQRAPEPEDIIWENIGVTTCEIVTRKLFTYFACLILLGASFAMIYGLSTVQKNSKHMTVSLSISIVISIINILLNSVIQLLTQYQKDITTSQYQISICVKTTVAQLVNSILLSMISAYYIKDNIYREGGLVDDVFYFSLINAFAYPVTRLINPYHFFRKVIRAYKSSPKAKLDSESQAEYNKYWEETEFQLGLQYVYPLKTIIYTAFFVSLQPIISIFAGIGITLMYFIEKRVLYHQSSRPRQGLRILNKTTNCLLYFSIISYGLGSLTWTNFLPDASPRYAFIPNVIIIGIGILVFFLDAAEMGVYCAGPSVFSMAYDEQRIRFLYEYDRLNPVTKMQGLKNFREYVLSKRDKVITKSKFSLESSIQLPTDCEKDINTILQIKKLIPGVDSRSLMLPQTLQSLTRPLTNRSNLHTTNLIEQCVHRSKLSNEMNQQNLSPINHYTHSPSQQHMMNSHRPMIQSQSHMISSFEPRIDHDKLLSIIGLNDQPGINKPNMLCSKFNPIDFIEAVQPSDASNR